MSAQSQPSGAEKEPLPPTSEPAAAWLGQIRPSKESGKPPANVGKPTPGPWDGCLHLRSDADQSCGCGYRGGIWGPDAPGDDGRIICEMGGTEHPGEEGLAPQRYDRPTELANARLIAAAPDLLGALKWATSIIQDAQDSYATYQGGGPFSLVLADCNAAIAKALGPQNASPKSREEQ